jgi:hypothetical protein
VATQPGERLVDMMTWMLRQFQIIMCTNEEETETIQQSMGILIDMVEAIQVVLKVS